jgi:hypothetical protein
MSYDPEEKYKDKNHEDRPEKLCMQIKIIVKGSKRKMRDMKKRDGVLGKLIKNNS